MPPGALESVQWRDAILAALTIALPVGLLASLLDFSSVWGISGGIAAISLYLTPSRPHYHALLSLRPS